MRGDLLALKVALAPCVIGYAEIATRLASRPDARAATNPYRVWIAEYAGAAYQEVAAKARAHLDDLADLYCGFHVVSSFNALDRRLKFCDSRIENSLPRLDQVVVVSRLHIVN